MKTGKLQTFALACALMTFVTGCTVAPKIAIPADSEVGANNEPSIRYISVGDHVRLELRSGVVVAGSVKQISSETVTIGRATNSGYEESTVELVDIRSSKEESLRWGAVRVLLFGASFVTIMAGAFLYAMSQGG